MGEATPKQYLPLAGVPLIRHALRTLLAVEAIAHVFVVLAPDDVHWDQHDWSDLSSRLTLLRCGGAQRAASVAAGLRAMQSLLAVDDWVLVHDAARACLTPAHVERLIAAVGDDLIGGLLAVPVADTLKQAGPDGHVLRTVPRDGLWQAQTPQMFRYGVLLDALERGMDVTDEASAVEALGFHPRLVAGDATNLKVTWPRDLQLAEWILKNRRD